MDNNLKKNLSALLGLIALAGILYGLYRLLTLLWDVFSLVNPTIGTGIIAASATIVVSVISVLVAKRLEYRSAILKELREKKTPFYEKLVSFIFRIAFSEKLGLEPLTEQETITTIADFTENLVIWGSDEVVAAWVRFRTLSVQDAKNMNVLFEVENLLLAIRKDLGHQNRGLTKGKILGTFVNDIDSIL